MKRYVIRRLLMAIPLLLAISFVCFVFINIIPSNPAEVALRVQQMPVITEEAIAEMEEMLGLNKPFLVRYFDWVLGCLRGDFGISYVNPARTVAGELARCLPATLQLAAASFVIVLVLSIPIGFLCAVYKDQRFDKLMRGLVFVTTAMPAYWVGLLLMWLVSVKLGVLPTNGSGTLRHLILPAFTVALSYMPNKMVNMISCMADSKIVILPMVNLFMVIIGMLMDDNSGTLLCGPILLPLVVSHAISLLQIVSPLCFPSKLTHIISVKRRLTFSIETSIAFL